MRGKISEGELAIMAQLKDVGDIKWEHNYRFCPHRRWEFDFAAPTLKLAVEIDGSGGGGGHHRFTSAREKENEKMNEAILAGWRVLHGSTEQARNGWLIGYVKRAL